MARTKKAVDGAFEIYAVDDGSINSIIQVSDPLHMRILNELSESPLSMSEVADITGKAQSTLSVHMEQLVNRNLISYDFDKNDSRRKIFRLISKKIASSKDVIEHPKDDSEDFFDKLMDYEKYPPMHGGYHSLSVLSIDPIYAYHNSVMGSFFGRLKESVISLSRS